MVDTAEQQREQLNSGTKEVAESHRFDEAALAAKKKPEPPKRSTIAERAARGAQAAPAATPATDR